jgi:hypothetical protein
MRFGCGTSGRGGILVQPGNQVKGTALAAIPWFLAKISKITAASLCGFCPPLPSLCRENRRRKS